MHFDDAVTVNGCRSVGYACHMNHQSRHAWAWLSWSLNWSLPGQSRLNSTHQLNSGTLYFPETTAGTLMALKPLVDNRYIKTSREHLVYSVFVHSSCSLLLLSAMEFIECSKRGKKLILNGYMYTKKAVKKNRIRWECSQRAAYDCKGAVITSHQVRLLF